MARQRRISVYRGRDGLMHYANSGKRVNGSRRGRTRGRITRRTRFSRFYR